MAGRSSRYTVGHVNVVLAGVNGTLSRRTIFSYWVISRSIFFWSVVLVIACSLISLLPPQTGLPQRLLVKDEDESSASAWDPSSSPNSSQPHCQRVCVMALQYPTVFVKSTAPFLQDRLSTAISAVLLRVECARMWISASRQVADVFPNIGSFRTRLLLIADTDRLPGRVGERGEGFWCPVGVAGCGGDFGVAHDGFAGVFGCAGLGEVGAEEVACGSHGDGWESGVLECALPAASFDVAGEWLAVAGEDEVVGCALVFVGEFEESEPCSGVEGDESDALSGFGWDEPEVAGDVAGLEPSGYGGVWFELLELPADLDAVDAVAGDEFAWGDCEAFGLAHAGGEGEVEHQGPHVVVILVVVERVPFAWLGVVCGVDGGCWLAGLEDDGVGGLVAWRYGGERGVDGDEFVAYGVVEDLFGADVDVVDGLAGSGRGEFVAHGFDGLGGDAVESHAADDAADGVAFAAVGVEYARFDPVGGLVEPSVEVEVDGGRVHEGQRALASALVDLGFELLSGGGLGGRLGLDPAASAGARVGVGLFAGVPDAFGVLPFAAGAAGIARRLFESYCIMPLHIRIIVCRGRSIFWNMKTALCL